MTAIRGHCTGAIARAASSVWQETPRQRGLTAGLLPVVRRELHEECELFETAREHRHHAVDVLKGSLDDDRPAEIDDVLVLRVRGGSDDDVHQAVLVLEREEHVA